ncbi:hypothetical protein PINS_up016464 [Pythium insidiosum]|nr:hypothetical protein PINS_up016464 [Pythium insidiosum]
MALAVRRQLRLQASDVPLELRVRLLKLQDEHGLLCLLGDTELVVAADRPHSVSQLLEFCVLRLV